MKTSKANSNSPNIYDSAKYFFFILKLIGLAPYELDAKTLKFKSGFFDIVWFLTHLSFWTFWAWYLTYAFREQPFRDFKDYGSASRNPLRFSILFHNVLHAFQLFQKKKTGKFYEVDVQI
jgi:hypothetical protein